MRKTGVEHVCWCVDAWYEDEAKATRKAKWYWSMPDVDCVQLIDGGDDGWALLYHGPPVSAWHAARGPLSAELPDEVEPPHPIVADAIDVIEAAAEEMGIADLDTADLDAWRAP